MEDNIISRFKRSWNAFLNKDPTMQYTYDIGVGSGVRPDRNRLSRGNEKSIVNSIINRIAIDVSTIDIKHCKLDENDRFSEEINSPLNNCLTLEANIDQAAQAFKRDIVMSMLEEGVVAVVPVDTNRDPDKGTFDIETLRTGKVIEWFPRHVKINLYNDRTGKREDIIMDKSTVAIIENPLYSVMNEPNSTMQRLKRKIALLDGVDEQASAGKLDIIVQLPYTIKSEQRRDQAERRRKDIEAQLYSSKYGIAYIDATEKVTQLNRPLENNLLKQIEYLTNMAYSQTGITQAVLDGTADEKTMLNYYDRTIDPIVYAIIEEFKRKFLTKTARTQRHTIECFRNPFKLVPLEQLAEISDKFTRNEILSSNEIRQSIGFKPSNDPKADQLINSNLNHPDETYEPYSEEKSYEDYEE